MEFLEPIKTFDQADQVMNEFFKNKKLIMGFGHRVYKNGDPRSDIIKEYSRQLAQKFNNKNLFEVIY